MVYAINEVSAYEDGKADGSPNEPAMHRLTQFDPKNDEPMRQYLYAVPDGDYSVSELLTIDGRYFVSIERVLPFDPEVGVRARIVLSTLAEETTDVLACPALPMCPAAPMARRVLIELPERYQGVLIDNLEAMAWGPPLPGGRRTLILAADDNFNAKQVSQFLAFALDEAV